jgi:tRNA pseudouridine32 synthase / 23S rRNA pseudouridine746 synthase
MCFAIMPGYIYAMHPKPDIALAIVYADESLIVVNKPSGLLAVPGRGLDKADCISLRVQQHYTNALVVHRLDQATSGLMLMARGLAMQRSLNLMFETRKVHKTYVAVVHGLVALDEGRIDLPLAADWPARPKQKVDSQLGKSALTDYRVLSRNTQNHTTRLELVPVTGRTHQLRVHLCAIGHPILGDGLYGSEVHTDAIEMPSATRLCLHAQHLALTHPQSAQSLHWTVGAEF